jgi:hypothetical protein
VKASITGEVGTVQLSKVAGAVLPAFQERIVHQKIFGGYENQRDWLWPIFKSSHLPLREILYPIEA